MGLLLAEETVNNPLAIVVQEESGRKLYLALYKTEDGGVSNGLVIGVEEGRVITSIIAADDKKDRNAGIREIKNTSRKLKMCCIFRRNCLDIHAPLPTKTDYRPIPSSLNSVVLIIQR